MQRFLKTKLAHAGRITRQPHSGYLTGDEYRGQGIVIQTGDTGHQIGDAGAGRHHRRPHMPGYLNGVRID